LGSKISKIKRIIRSDEAGIKAEVEVPRNGTFTVMLPGGKYFAPGKSVPIELVRSGRKMTARYAG
jgi:hypothetical protein